MEKSLLNYRVIIEKEAYPNGAAVYTAYCPTLDIADYGDTIEKSLESMREAIELRLEVLAQEGSDIPVEAKESLVAKVAVAP